MVELLKPRYSERNVDFDITNDHTFEVYFLEERARFIATNVYERGRNIDAELNIEYPDGIPFISHAKLNLYSQDKRRRLAEDLAKKYTDLLVQWDEMLEYAVRLIIYKIKQPPEVMDASADPDSMAICYLVEPLLVEKQPTSIYCPGGVGKSIEADHIAVLGAHGIASSDGLLSPREFNSLILDWEEDIETHRRYITAIERGMGLEHKPDAIKYLKCTTNLESYAEYIKELNDRYNIELLIIDSYLGATADYPKGMTDAQIASAFYNTLRDFEKTTLIIDHTTKASMSSDNSDSTGANMYGSVVKYNRSRSQFELKMDDSFADSDHKEYVLIHKKFNLGRKLKPMAFSIDFENEGNVLKTVKFSSCDIADNPNLSKSLTKKQRAINAIKAMGGIATIKQVAEYLEEPDNEKSIGVILAKNKKDFAKIKEGTYGLVFI